MIVKSKIECPVPVSTANISKLKIPMCCCSYMSHRKKRLLHQEYINSIHVQGE
jgi:hypothetical protein